MFNWGAVRKVTHEKNRGKARSLIARTKPPSHLFRSIVSPYSVILSFRVHGKLRSLNSSVAIISRPRREHVRTVRRLRYG